MREEYEIQLIDETSGEQIKTVSPTVESHTVYHGEKKLSGYLKQVEEQSKSNLVLVTTMQKLLSEKIDKLERDMYIMASNNINIVETGRTNAWAGTDTTVQRLPGLIVGENTDGDGVVNFGFDHNASMKLSQPIEKGDTVYFMFQSYTNTDNLELYTQHIGKGYENFYKKIIVKDKIYYIWKKTCENSTSGFTTTIKTTSNKLILNERHLISLEEPGFFIDNLTRSGIQKELDFYKSQLEKLKLAKEVDLNLLLTL